MNINIVEADYNNESHSEAIIKMLDIYSRDPMGLNGPLPTAARINVIEGLKQIPTAITFLAYQNDNPVGIANCFLNYSTFNACKLLNIHDLAVDPEWRGLGIGEKLLDTVQRKAKDLKCCQLTLEVREDNPAQKLYERFGFSSDDPKLWFMTKELY